MPHVAALTVKLPVPDTLLDMLAPARRRVVFVANDKRVAADGIVRLGLLPDDTLVQFNAALFFDAFADIACHKVHVYNADNMRRHWGFAADGSPLRDYTAQQASSLTLLFTWCITPEARAYIEALPPSAQAGMVRAPHDVSFWNYPAGKWPSVGFLGISVVRHINLVRTLLGTPKLELVLFAFTGDYAKNVGWSGHDFAFEQRVYAGWHDLVRIDYAGLRQG